MIKKFAQVDWNKMRLQPEQCGEELVDLTVEANAYSVWAGDDLLAFVWWRQIWNGRFEVYSYINQTAGKHMISLVRQLRRFIEQKAAEAKAVRVEITVLAGFAPGERLAEMLGFDYEGTMRKVYRGADYKLFARIF